MQGLKITPEILNKLAMNYDPSPIIAEMNAPPSLGSGVTPPAGTWSGLMPGGPQMPQTPGFMNPQQLQMMQGMMQPKQGQMPQAPAVAPKQAVPMKISVPDISSLLSINVGPQPKKAPSLGSLIGG